MKIGLITSIFEEMGLKEVVDFAAESGLECLEVACWPTSGGEKRRYAGVSHIKTENLTAEKAEEIKAYMREGISLPWLITQICWIRMKKREEHTWNTFID